MIRGKVLLVDDDPDFRGAVKMALDHHDFEVIEAVDGEEGEEKAKLTRPDLIILDVMMPKRDGYSVLYELKNNPVTQAIPIIMLTSLGQTKEGKTGAELLAKGHEADGYLDKPIDIQVLVHKINELIIKKTPAADESSIKILLVDDDKDFISAVKTILEEHNYEMIVVNTGEEGLAAAARERPDLILLDVMLPGKDGYAVCQELKENKDTQLTPVVMLTSVGKKLTDPGYAKVVAVIHKADDYIEKPVEARELLNRIRKLVGPQRRLV